MRELHCAYCYAPKQAAALDREGVLAWAIELDAAGCLGVGFGDGEPTAYRRFAQLCSDIAQSTSMAVTFTTHGHRLTPELVESLREAVHFVRLSVDGVGATYERLRGRPFAAVVQAAGLLGSLRHHCGHVRANQLKPFWPSRPCPYPCAARRYRSPYQRPGMQGALPTLGFPSG
ncbi:radical SAM protein [Streptomyces sp. SID2888]|nr:radical SAM protein [Streptomyces sp. SID2888]